jgi:hypothetical protein
VKFTAGGSRRATFRRAAPGGGSCAAPGQPDELGCVWNLRSAIVAAVDQILHRIKVGGMAENIMSDVLATVNGSRENPAIRNRLRR